MRNQNKPLSDAEYAEMLENKQKLQAAYAQNPEATMKTLKDAVQEMRDLPSQSGDLSD